MVILYQLPSNSGPQCQSGPRATYLKQCAYLHSVHVWNPKIFDAPWSFVSMFKTLLYINIYLKSFYSFPSYMFPVLCRSFALFHLSVHLKLGEKQKWYFMLFQNISVSVVLDEKVIGFKYDRLVWISCLLCTARVFSRYKHLTLEYSWSVKTYMWPNRKHSSVKRHWEPAFNSSLKGSRWTTFRSGLKHDHISHEKVITRFSFHIICPFNVPIFFASEKCRQRDKVMAFESNWKLKT